MGLALSESASCSGAGLNGEAAGSGRRRLASIPARITPTPSHHSRWPLFGGLSFFELVGAVCFASMPLQPEQSEIRINKTYSYDGER